MIWMYINAYDSIWTGLTICVRTWFLSFFGIGPKIVQSINVHVKFIWVLIYLTSVNNEGCNIFC